MSEVRSIENKDTKVIKKSTKTVSLKESQLDLQKLILEVKSGKEKNTSLIKKSKKEIARLLTNLRINNGK